MVEIVDGNLYKISFLPDIRHLHPREIALFHQGEEIRDLALHPISNQVAHFFHLQEGLGIHLGITAGDNDQRLWIGAVYPSNGLPRLEVGPVSDRAGVNDREVGFFVKKDKLISLPEQGVRECFGLKLVDFATKGGN
jgi:hypothetical protein